MKCDYNFKRSWRCIREKGHDGPCGLIPKWWNMSHDAWLYRACYWRTFF